MCTECEAATIKSIDAAEKPTRRTIKIREKWQFLMKQAYLVEQIFGYNEEPWLVRENKRALIDRAREELGYSLSTTGEDILRSLLGVYVKFVKRQVEPKDPKQVWLNKEVVL
jgi:hypothetical protein